jgi:hypothetical protein
MISERLHGFGEAGDGVVWLYIFVFSQQEERGGEREKCIERIRNEIQS